MRFRLKERPKLGTEKIKIRFLLFPKCIGGEVRWLEFVKIKYVRKEVIVSYDLGGITERRWIAEEFLPYDPVFDCDTFRKDGCSHVDGMLCDIDDCDIFKPRK